VKSLLPALAFIVALAAVAALFIADTGNDAGAPAADATAALDADYDYVQDMRTTRFSADGQALSQLQATRVTYYADGDRAELVAPRFQTFGATGDPWQVAADAGTLVPDAARNEDRLDLAGNVELHKPLESGNFVDVRTNELTVFVATEELISAAPVTVQTRDTRIESVGMRALLAEDYIQWNNGKGTYVPAPKP
jgi:LPS export ABC transporter protein LptC